MDCGTLALDELRMLTKEELMEPETTCKSNDTTKKGKLYMTMELSQKEWKLGFSVGPGQAPRLRTVASRDLGGFDGGDPAGRRAVRTERERGGGNASSPTWQAPQDDVYFARIVQVSGSSFDCGATYNFAALATYRIYLPLVIW
jgi:hypothetical protein